MLSCIYTVSYYSHQDWHKMAFNVLMCHQETAHCGGVV